MEKLAIFLTISLLSLLTLRPKNKKDIGLYAISIPTGLFLLIVLGYASVSGSYYAGQATTESILPLLISSAVLFWGLNKKLQNEKPKFPIILLIAVIAAWGLTGYKYYLKTQIDNYLSKNNNKIATLINTETTTYKEQKQDVPRFIDAQYKDLSIKLPEDWNFKPHEVERDNRYQLLCWDKSNFNTFVVTEIHQVMKLKDLMDFMKASVINYAAYKNCVFKPYETGKLDNNETLTCNYTGQENIKDFFGKLIIFTKNSNTYLIIYQGNNEYYKSGIPENIIASLNIGNQ